MKHVFKLAAAVLVTGIAGAAAAKQKTIWHPSAVVVGPAAMPQPYLPQSDWENVPPVMGAGYAFETYQCHSELQPSAIDPASFKRVKQFCAVNVKAAMRMKTAVTKADTALIDELIDLAGAELHDRSGRPATASAAKRHAYVGNMVANMIRRQQAAAKEYAQQSYYKDVDNRFARMFPHGVTVMPLPAAAALQP